MNIRQYPSMVCLENYSLWNKLARSTNQADPFCSTSTWQLSFHEAFSPRRRLFIEESANSMIVLAEKRMSPERILLTPIEPLWLFGCPLLGKDAVDLFSEKLWYIRDFYKPIFPRIYISGIRPKGKLYQRLKEKLGWFFDMQRYSTNTQCVASLSGGLDGYLSRRSANHRQKLRKQSKKASEEGIGFERVMPISSGEVEAAYARMIAVELRSWKGKGRCSMAEQPAKDFYEIMLHRLSVTKDARIIFATRDGKDIGFIFGGKAGKVYRGQQFSYDDDWKRYSIGNLLQVEQIKWLCEEGARRYDMGPVSDVGMVYKSHWAEKRFKMETWILDR